MATQLDECAFVSELTGKLSLCTALVAVPQSTKLVAGRRSTEIKRLARCCELMPTGPHQEEDEYEIAAWSAADDRGISSRISAVGMAKLKSSSALVAISLPSSNLLAIPHSDELVVSLNESAQSGLLSALKRAEAHRDFRGHDEIYAKPLWSRPSALKAAKSRVAFRQHVKNMKHLAKRNLFMICFDNVIFLIKTAFQLCANKVSITKSFARKKRTTKLRRMSMRFNLYGEINQIINSFKLLKTGDQTGLRIAAAAFACGFLVACLALFARPLQPNFAQTLKSEQSTAFKRSRNKPGTKSLAHSKKNSKLLALSRI